MLCGYGELTHICEEHQLKPIELDPLDCRFSDPNHPALSTETLAARCALINKAIGEKLAISDSELASTVDACKALITQGVDLTGAEGSSSSATQKLAAIR